MTTTSGAPEPRYATQHDLEALEGRLINRLAALELGLVREMHGTFRTTIALILPLYALWLATLLAMINILQRLPVQP